MWGGWLILANLLWGVTLVRVTEMLSAFGLVVIATPFGYFFRRAAAGQVLPTSFDTNIADRRSR
ncbi:hypothetical protein ACFO0N_03450 [Halobium salinum]|uniref:Inner membrane component domain-containing protein n=1 Tax=Halobium salinum TaxID=1364940 RepID=A0ABD5P8C2_9EURY|nr:hypothetical protein [Halobium salinum]